MAQQYQRVTADYWELQGYYAQGWECLCAASSRREALGIVKAYRENEPNTPLRIVKKRERIEKIEGEILCQK